MNVIRTVERHVMANQNALHGAHQAHVEAMTGFEPHG